MFFGQELRSAAVPYTSLYSRRRGRFEHPEGSENRIKEIPNPRKETLSIAAPMKRYPGSHVSCWRDAG